MINCRKCGYSVPSNLKYAIMSNMCPSCGDVLFGDKDMSEISSISSNISRQEFSQGMNKVLVNDIALFIFQNYANTYDDTAGLSDIDPDPNDSVDTDVSGDDSLEKIRDEVRREVSLSHDDSDDLDSSNDLDEDSDRKIARLKRLAREASSASNRGVSVKRVT